MTGPSAIVGLMPPKRADLSYLEEAAELLGLSSGEVTFLVSLYACAGLVLLFALVILGVWIWMMMDWTKRTKTDPAEAEKYKIQMIIGWPFGYYINVFRKNGPARK
jgi:hypothetical protein